MIYAAIVGTAARLLLAWSGVGAFLAWRIEVSTAANSNLELREGLALLRLGISPYTGSSCRTPPLGLWLYGALADHDFLYVLPNTLLDLLAASLLYLLAMDLLSGPRRVTDESRATRVVTGAVQDPDRRAAAAGVGIGVEPSCESSSGAYGHSSATNGPFAFLLQPTATPNRYYPSCGSPPSPGRGLRSALPSALVWTYLLNPFTLAAAAGGTTSPLENLAVVAALYGACKARPGLAALGLAVSTYMSLHSAVLLLPVACLLSYGPEDVATPLCVLQRKVCRTTADGCGGGGGDGVGGGVAPGGRVRADGSDGVMGSSGQVDAGCGPAGGHFEGQEKQQQQQQQHLRKGRRKQAGTVNVREGWRAAEEEDEQEEADEPAVSKGTDRKSAAGARSSEAIAAAATVEEAETDNDGDDDDARGLLRRNGGGEARRQQDILARSASISPGPKCSSPPSCPDQGRRKRLLPPPPRPPRLLPWRQLLHCTALTMAVLAFLVAASDLFLLLVPPPPGIVVTSDGSGAGGGSSSRAAKTCILGAAEQLMARQSPGPEAEAGAALLRAAGSSLAACWAVRVYGSQILLDDATPNVGQWWYLSMEVFNDAKAYLRILAHSLLFALAPPLAKRLGVRRPLALFLIQLLCLGFNKPYPSVADLGLAAPMLLLLGRQQLAAARLRLLLPASLLLLCVLGPAMQNMWLSYESANSNFFYSITLLYGVWQVVLLGHVLGLTLWMDRVLILDIQTAVMKTAAGGGVRSGACVVLVPCVGVPNTWIQHAIA
ncbi:hypothetical protein VOLCADRAFT_87261 [Volvox carteri f. nagariensis]|uniref:GPI transamidase subunit PIG-U n=1 Tax=Volvox carteri f. nagariensis TaxID=3068 RepID=D8TKV5_VOLCA|nr:uncharacterized protein VOLCADRAFT_87261 [Volvox carteri f. nagariensis]EFJ51630.1 hypothetical protein VOLCADRAFT_87261 [Volvox carteri f. nagariensis]|eukprot:XP_002947040.1 hypothetical protein VOLCADRAFT_87261 [Volvox carteri f. nagariensis]